MELKTKTTALGAIVLFIEREKRMPKVSEFMESGFSRSSYYKARTKYHDYLQARLEELEDNGSPFATYEDDIAEGFIK